MPLNTKPLMFVEHAKWNSTLWMEVNGPFYELVALAVIQIPSISPSYSADKDSSFAYNLEVNNYRVLTEAHYSTLPSSSYFQFM
jgi:hypothetical protein